jgi:hypothetical protein
LCCEAKSRDVLRRDVQRKSKNPLRRVVVRNAVRRGAALWRDEENG